MEPDIFNTTINSTDMSANENVMECDNEQFRGLNNSKIINNKPKIDYGFTYISKIKHKGNLR